MKTKMKQINKIDNSVKLPWTIYKGFTLNLSKNENNVINFIKDVVIACNELC